MALVNCKECKKPISSTVKSCPHCGYQKKSSGCINSVLVLGVAIYAIIKILGVNTNQYKTDQVTKSTDISSITINASSLINAYSENEVSADNNFKDKWLTINGTLTGISKNITDDVVLDVGGNGLNSVMVELRDSETKKASHLNKGQLVTVLCKGRGAILSSPYVSDCQIK